MGNIPLCWKKKLIQCFPSFCVSHFCGLDWKDKKKKSLQVLGASHFIGGKGVLCGLLMSRDPGSLSYL